MRIYIHKIYALSNQNDQIIKFNKRMIKIQQERTDLFSIKSKSDQNLHDDYMGEGWGASFLERAFTISFILLVKVRTKDLARKIILILITGRPSVRSLQLLGILSL
jgi:hypothetical protein